MPSNSNEVEIFNIDQYLSNNKILIDNYLKKIFNQPEFIEPKVLWDAIRYSSIDGGKRLRANLCIGAFQTFSKNNTFFDDVIGVASSIEIIHAMSLIHDDLPCMDDDDLRRGKPSCHKAFGEANALLAGDAMLTLSVHIVIQYCNNLSSKTKLEIINELCKSFTFGLVPGQVLDLSKGVLSLEDISHIYKNKTASLIKSSILCGFLIALDSGETNSLEKEKTIQSLEKFGLNIGIAFQIIDDILDITGSVEILGKTIGKDIKQEKNTYPKLLGIEKSKKIASDLIEEAIKELTIINIKSQVLFDMADKMINRIK